MVAELLRTTDPGSSRALVSLETLSNIQGGEDSCVGELEEEKYKNNPASKTEKQSCKG